MKRLLKFTALLVGIALAGTAIDSGNTSITKTEKVEGTEWNVTVKRVIHILDGNCQYTIADTVRVN